MIEIKSPPDVFSQRPRLSLAQTSLAVKKTTRTSGGDLISLTKNREYNFKYIFLLKPKDLSNIAYI